MAITVALTLNVATDKNWGTISSYPHRAAIRLPEVVFSAVHRGNGSARRVGGIHVRSIRRSRDADTEIAR